jgi:hypothetical protein
VLNALVTALQDAELVCLQKLSSVVVQTMKTLLIPVVLSLALLTACGGEAPGGSSSKQGQSGGGKTPPADWNAVDACSVIDGSAYGGFVGKSVAATSLGLSRPSDGTSAATSECTYELSEGGRPSILLRWSPIGDNSEGAINEARNGLEATAKAFNGKVETVDGVGKAAYWVALTNSLNVFIGEDKFAIINVPTSDTARDQAIAIARKLGA